MGKSATRKTYNHKRIESDTLVSYWKNPYYNAEIQKASVQFKNSVDGDMLESLKWEGLWNALSTYRDDTKLELKYWVYRRVRWTIIRHIEAKKKRLEFANNDEEISSRPTKGNPLLELENREYINTILGQNCCDRDISIFNGHLDGYSAVELADQHCCGKKNVHRIITRCKGLIQNNATRVDLSR